MSEYYTLKVKEVVQETADTVTIHLKQPLFRKVKYKPGQFITVIVTINGQKLRRSYSMSSSPKTDDTIAITVKRVENGLVSNYLNDKVKAGDSLEIMEAMGNFNVETSSSNQRHIVLFGAGSGITPLMSIAKAVLHDEAKSSVSLVYGNRNEQNIIFKKQLDQMKAQYKDRFTLVHVLSQPSKDWNGYSGRIDETKTANIANLLPKFDASKTDYFLCGPDGMMDEVKKGLKKLQVAKEKIHSESFVSAVASTAASTVSNGTISQQTVTIILNGSSHQVVVPPSKSILDAGLDAGLDMPYSCQSGLCTACRGLCKSGSVKMDSDDGLTEKEINQGYILNCVGHPLTENVVIEIG